MTAAVAEDWPEVSAPGTTPARRRLHVVRDPVPLPVTLEPAPALEEIGAAQVEPYRTCPACDTVCPAAMPALTDGTLVLLDAAGGLYEQLAVLVEGRWQVRPVSDTEQVPLANRRRQHRCQVYPHRCQSPGHGQEPARLYAGGLFCDQCARRAGGRA